MQRNISHRWVGLVWVTKTGPTAMSAYTSIRSAETTDYVLWRLRTKFAERGFAFAGPAA